MPEQPHPQWPGDGHGERHRPPLRRPPTRRVLTPVGYGDSSLAGRNKNGNWSWPMTSFGDLEARRRRVLDLAPLPGGRLDSPYAIPTDLYEALRHVPHDVGGQPDAPAPYLEKE